MNERALWHVKSVHHTGDLHHAKFQFNRLNSSRDISLGIPGQTVRFGSGRVKLGLVLHMKSIHHTGDLHHAKFQFNRLNSFRDISFGIPG